MEYTKPYMPQFPTAVSPAAIGPANVPSMPTYVSPANVAPMPTYVSPANVAPMPMPMPYPMPYPMPCPPVSPTYVKPAHIHKAPFTSAGEILVLFILLVIISRCFRFVKHC